MYTINTTKLSYRVFLKETKIYEDEDEDEDKVA